MKKIASNYLIQLGGKILSLLAGLVVIAMLTRYLDEEAWGAYITATTFLSFFGVFVDFGLTLTLTQMISDPKADEKKIVGAIMGLRLASGAIFYSLAIITVTLLPYSDTAKAAVAAGAAAFFFMSAEASMIGLFQKHLALKRYVLAELAGRAIYLIATGLCLIFGLGLLPILGAMGLSNAAWLIFILMAAKPIAIIRPRIDWKIWKEAFFRSAPIAISTVFNLIYLRGDVLILAWAKPDEVAQYGTAYKVVDVMTAFPTMLMGLVLPQLTMAWYEKNKENFKKILQKTFDAFAIVAIPLFLGGQLTAQPLTQLIAGERYALAGEVLHFLIFAIVCVFVSTLYGHTIVALGKQKIMMWGYAFTAAVAVVGYFILIPPLGMWGAATVTCFSEFLIAALTFIVVSKVAKLLPNLVVTAKAIFSGLVMFLVLWFLPDWPILIIIGLGALIYGAVMIAVKGIDLNELKNLAAKS